MDALTAVGIVILAIVASIIIYLVLVYVRDLVSRHGKLKQKYGYVPGHIELYFEEYFPTMIKEWDLVVRSRLGQWMDGVKQKMVVIDADLTHIQQYRNTIDTRLDRLEQDVNTLEKK
jgi:hypothetical protein